MGNHIYQNAVGGYLALSILLGASFMNAPRADGQQGIYAQICGSSQLLFIPLEEENPEPGKTHLTACHAICANKEFESEEEA